MFKDKENLLNSIGFTLTVIFFGIIFLSKAGINIVSSLLLLFSLVYIFSYKRSVFKDNTFLIILLSPILISCILSIFSELGIKAPVNYLGRFKYILLLIPLTLFVDSIKRYMIVYFAICFSGILAISYGVVTGENSYGTFHGFYKIGRTADLMMMLSLSVVVFLLYKKKTNDLYKTISMKLLFFLLLSLYLWALLYSGIRGAWVGFIAGIMALLLFHPKKSLFLISVLLVLVSVFISFNKRADIYKNEFLSIFDLKTNASNNTRIHLLKTGLDFSTNHIYFGTGAKNSEKLFINFFDSQSEEYREKYYLAREFPKDFHNSFLQILVETGIISLLLFIFSQVYLLFRVFFYYFKIKKSEESLLLVITIVTSASFFVSQFFHGEFHSYGSLLYYFFIFGSCMVTKDFINNNTFIGKLWGRS